jgi:hypothetical protein
VRKNIRQVRRGGAVRFEIHVEHVRQHGALVNARVRAGSVDRAAAEYHPVNAVELAPINIQVNAIVPAGISLK